MTFFILGLLLVPFGYFALLLYHIKRVGRPLELTPPGLHSTLVKENKAKWLTALLFFFTGLFQLLFRHILDTKEFILNCWRD